MKITNKWKLPSSIVRAVTNDTYSGPKVGSNKISVSTLISPPRIHFLKAKHWDEIEEDVADSIWKILGSAAHKVMERAEGKQTISEERLEKTIDGITISGQFDLYDSEIQELHDYKTTSTWTIIYNPKGKPEWEAQMNIYAHLLVENGFPVKALKIIAILRDHSDSRVEDGGNYPPIPIHILDIPLWEKVKVEAYIKERVSLFKSCKDLEDNALPECTPSECWEKRKTFKTKADEVTRTRCERYCQVSRWCNQYSKFKGAK